jgi:hypothetical protein
MDFSRGVFLELTEVSVALGLKGSVSDGLAYPTKLPEKFQTSSLAVSLDVTVGRLSLTARIRCFFSRGD